MIEKSMCFSKMYDMFMFKTEKNVKIPILLATVLILAPSNALATRETICSVVVTVAYINSLISTLLFDIYFASRIPKAIFQAYIWCFLLFSKKWSVSVLLMNGFLISLIQYFLQFENLVYFR